MTEALHAVARWVARQPEGVALELVCAEHPAPARGDPARTVVRMPTCVREVPAHEVLELLTAGAATIRVRQDGCAQPETATEHLRSAAAVLAAAGVSRLRITQPIDAAAGTSPEPAADDGAAPETTGRSPGGRTRPTRGLRRRRAGRERDREVLDARQMPVPRRQMLGLGTGPTRDLADPYLSGPRRLNAVIAALVPAGSRAGLDRPSAALQLRARGCTACGVCVRACPTDALSLRHFGAAPGVAPSNGTGTGTGAADPGTAPLVTSLLQDPTGCDSCQLCVQLCPQDALTAAGAWAWDDLLARVDSPALTAVASLTTAQCGRCRTRFPTTDAASLCPVCTFRRQNPFSSRLPPGH